MTDPATDPVTEPATDPETGRTAGGHVGPVRAPGALERAGLAPVAGAATDVGRTRPVNEDGYLALAPAFLVVDGMGGHVSGRAATRAALGELRALAGTAVTSEAQVVDAVTAAARAVAAIPSVALNPPGCTVAGVVLAELDGEPAWLVLNIGDSRAYLLRDDVLRQVTVDHSQVQELIDAGRLTEAEGRLSPRRHVITRALGGGTEDSGVPSLHRLDARPGDRFLICSDGVSDELDDEGLATVLGAGLGPQRTAELIVAAALEAGGHDNTTALVVDGAPAGSGVRVRDPHAEEPRT